MPEHPAHLDMEPFPWLKWDVDCWTGGEVDLVSGHAGLTVIPPEGSRSLLPTEAQREAMSYHLEHGAAIKSAVLSALLPYYESLRPRYASFLGHEAHKRMPALQTPVELLPLVDLRQVYLHPWTKDGSGYVGFLYGCTWDQEHGLGVMLLRDQVIEIGGADLPFCFEPPPSS